MSIFLLVVNFLLVPFACSGDNVICYYQSWAAYRKEEGNGVPENFDANLCTHINYAFILLHDDGNLRVADEYLDIEKGLFKRVTSLKKFNPKLKVLLSVGGAGDATSGLFKSISVDPVKRRTFIESTRHHLETYNFDGVDIDWEYPKEEDKENFVAFLQEVRDEMDKHNWLLTAAVQASPSGGYDVPRISNILHIINVMSYDFYGPWSSYVGQNSPLFASSVESAWERENLNFAAAAQSWLNKGAPPAKICMGMAFYARTFSLADPSQHTIHAPIAGPGTAGEFTQSPGSLSYAEVCKHQNDFKQAWDDEQKVPYNYNDNQWIGFDNPRSLQLKVDYVKKHKFGGVMVWSLDFDDVHGICHQKQELLRAVNKKMGRKF